jgi:hypothetical protein
LGENLLGETGRVELCEGDGGVGGDKLRRRREEGFNSCSVFDNSAQGRFGAKFEDTFTIEPFRTSSLWKRNEMIPSVSARATRQETSCGKVERTDSSDVVIFTWFALGGSVADGGETLRNSTSKHYSV